MKRIIVVLMVSVFFFTGSFTVIGCAAKHNPDGKKKHFFYDAGSKSYRKY